MRNKLNTAILVVLLISISISAKEGPPNSDPVALSIVWDASAVSKKLV
jgi:hypothetical protein